MSISVAVKALGELQIDGLYLINADDALLGRSLPDHCAKVCRDLVVAAQPGRLCETVLNGIEVILYEDRHLLYVEHLAEPVRQTVQQRIQSGRGGERPAKIK